MKRISGSLVFLTALGVFLAGTVAGVMLLFAPAPTPEPRAVCENRVLETGEKLTSNLLTVNVFNAGSQTGLANRVQIDLERRGFLGGKTGNYSGGAKVSGVTILTSAPDDPKVRLLAEQFKDKVKFAQLDVEVEHGLVLVVGNKFSGLKKKAPKSVKLKAPVTVCVPDLELG